MITKEIEIDNEKFRLTLTDHTINQVNNLKSLYNTAYDDSESFEQVSSEISSIIQEISNGVTPKPDDSHLDNLKPCLTQGHSNETLFHSAKQNRIRLLITTVTRIS